jgi:CubicO group peptidase (beta-lactamase class C family)
MTTRALRWFIFALLWLSSQCLSEAQTSTQTTPQRLEIAKPESVGMSSSRLARIDAWQLEQVAQNRMPGGMLLVARRGKIVHHSAVGYHDVATRDALERDQIFRIMSMSKAITSVAVMMLYEEGYFQLDDPLEQFIPEFADAKVLVHFNEKDTTWVAVPAKTKPTIRHLLNHTAGITYGHPMYQKAGIPDFFNGEAITLQQMIPRLARLPLLHEPGEKFTYGLNTDVLGYLVERVSGMRFGDFLEKRIFTPLGMGDTGFYVKKGQEHRLMHLYTETDDSTGVRRHADYWEENYPIAGAKTYESGGAGLTSTVLDYAKFLQMLLNGGSYNGQQLLSRKTVELMCTNQIGTLDFWGGPNRFGLGFEITTEVGAQRAPGTVGALRWGGRNFSDYIFDPKEQLLVVWTSQVVPTRHWWFTDQVRRMAYQAIVD